METKLLNIFKELAEGERKVEISRQVLSDNYEFDAFQIFRTLDTQGKNYIDATDLIKYYNYKGITITEIEAQLIILFYDQNFDGVLSYEEFTFLIQSEKTMKTFSKTSPGSDLGFNVEYSFLKLLENELQLTIKILNLLNDIQSCRDFNIHLLYHSLKSCNGITNNGIKCFLEKYDANYLDSDINSIIKRIDFNKDGKIDFCEFHAFLGFPNCCLCCPCISCSVCGACYCEHCFCHIVCSFHGCVHDNYQENDSTNNANDRISEKKQ